MTWMVNEEVDCESVVISFLQHNRVIMQGDPDRQPDDLLNAQVHDGK